MTFTLTIKCHGVIGYVESDDGKQVALFLPKARRRIVRDQVAYVRFPKNANKPKRKVAPHPDGAPDELRHFVLKREWLSLELPGGVEAGYETLVLDKAKDDYSTTPTSKDEKSLLWVPDLDELSEEKDVKYGEIDPKYFDNPRKAHPRLISRVDFTQGMLGTTGVDPVQVRFERRQEPADAQRLPIARELQLTLRVKGEKVVLRSRKLNGKPWPDNVRDMVFEPPQGGALELVIGNESEADIYRTSLPIQPIDTVSSPCMREFEVYYAMTAPKQNDVAPRQNNVGQNPRFPFLRSRPGSETCCSIAKFRPRKFTSPTSDTELLESVQAGAWTFLAYLAADNNLSEIAEEDVDKLEKPQDHGVGVVIQVDRLGRPTQRLLLDDDEGFTPTGDEPGNLNAGDPAVLTEFLKEGQKLRPAKNTAVFLLSHGAGLLDFEFPDSKRPPKKSWLRYLFAVLCRVIGSIFRTIGRKVSGKSLPFALDLSPKAINPDVTAGDYLSNDELAGALKAALPNGKRFAIVGFDACVMALVELAYELRDCGSYLIASQDDVHLRGFPYDEILKDIGSKNPRDATVQIVDVFGKDTAKDDLATLSAVELANVGGLVDELDKLGGVLGGLVNEQNLPRLAAARNHARAFSNFYYIDLKGFTDGLLKCFPEDQHVTDAAQKVAEALDRAVVRTSKDKHSTERMKKTAHGLSVYLPNSALVERVYKELAFTKYATRWAAFARAYSQAPRPPKEQ